MLLFLQKIITYINSKRGYVYYGIQEREVIKGVSVGFKYFEEIRDGAIDEFYRKKRFCFSPKAHLWKTFKGEFSMRTSKEMKF